MITLDQAKAELRRVFVVYPSFRQILNQSESPQETLDGWASMLLFCDLDDIKDSIGKIVSGDVEPVGQYEKADCLPRKIRSMANDLRSARNERRRMDGLHVQATEPTSKDARFMAAMRESRRLGMLVRDKGFRRSQNAILVDQISKWLSGNEKQLPYWFGKSERVLSDAAKRSCEL